MTVRLATNADRGSFIELWAEYLPEVEKIGSEVAATPRSLEAHLRLFDAMQADQVDGFVMLDGALRGGQMVVKVVGFDLRFGKTAQSLGTYVRPSHRGQGIALALYEASLEELRRRGFKAMFGGYHVGNEGGRAVLEHFGFRVHQTLVVKEL